MLTRSAARRLGGWLSRELGEPVRLESSEKLGGGAGRETWQVTVVAGVRDGQSRRHFRVVRGEVPPGPGTGRSPAEEFALLRVVHEAGVLVPRPLLLCEDVQVLGAPFFVTDCVPGAEYRARPPPDPEDGVRGPGLARPPERERDRPALDDPSFPREREPVSSAGIRLGRPTPRSWLTRPGLARQLGGDLAKLHRITPAGGGLRFLAPSPRNPAAARLAAFRGRLDAIGDPQPVLEWTMRQLERHAPESGGPVLCHGAPGAGAGSRLAEEGRLFAITDWAASRWGDPCEDLGEFCAACRRLASRHREADGAASRAAFLGAYRETSVLHLDEEVLRYWEVMATLHSAVAALEQGQRFVAGGDRSIELALTGRRVAEMEIDLLFETDRLAMERAHA